jgi:spore germination protein YaaH
MIGEDFPYYLTKDSQVDLEFAPVIKKGDNLYFALDYVALFVSMDYHIYTDPEYLKIDYENPPYPCAVLKKDSAIRYQGGIKSPILDDVLEGEQIGVIEEMEDWAKVVSTRGIVGYIQIKQFEYMEEMFGKIIAEDPMIPLNYTSIQHEGKINMAFEQVFADPATNFTKDTANVKSVNVIAPTLYRIKDNDGTVEALASSGIVAKAHEKNMDVWAVWTDVDYEVDMKEILGSSTKRNALISRMISEAKDGGYEGINIDFERITQESSRDFVQFLRELSVETHKEGIILSVDNYALASVTKFYDRKEQGNVCDYVIIMGYDEHWASSQEAGSVASINYVERGIKETLKEVPAKKVINAVPFYTRIWRTTDDGKVSSETIGMELQNNWIEQTGITLAWDNESCQKYGEKMIGGKNCQIWVEDAESLEVKLKTMDSYKLAGVAEWKLGFETPDIWDVFEKYMAGEYHADDGM